MHCRQKPFNKYIEFRSVTAFLGLKKLKSSILCHTCIVSLQIQLQNKLVNIKNLYAQIVQPKNLFAIESHKNSCILSDLQRLKNCILGLIFANSCKINLKKRIYDLENP